MDVLKIMALPHLLLDIPATLPIRDAINPLDVENTVELMILGPILHGSFEQPWPHSAADCHNLTFSSYFRDARICTTFKLPGPSIG